MMAELNELTHSSNSSSSTSKTVTTNLSPISTDEIEPIFEEIIVTPSTSSATSSSSMYGVRTPTPPFCEIIKRVSQQYRQPPQLQLYYPHSQLETDDDEGMTITEIVEVHRIPSSAAAVLFTIEDNNNPSPATTTPTITSASTTITTTTATATRTNGTSNDDDDADIESNVNNNNTSCSLSSTLTDSKTLDVRTPIVV
ncbi:probable G-protein coupled receptor CG31760 [Musca domestica]|uniref:Probable G-protein coupled receptor CG31760 n=1 Tax=Musca domestica TaxID=7370 RepID=A0A1I8NJ96_MUSDO|nr:probable G-protein coupled receptor CG31760 [Musca domestica]